MREISKKVQEIRLKWYGMSRERMKNMSGKEER